eukprot:TRINITY_DN592_c0_g1_i2.p4 TRINITY_DN592_c0_g1~~TRINITY_DN592_c0_g1_i2.p4  ORF type:complete len:160 (-),score=6.36 TRINITY_DN592_c0_g1_i2:268-747(-)
MFERQGDMAKLLLFLTMFINFITTFGSVFTSDRLGRRILLLWGCIGCGLGLLVCMLSSTDDDTSSSTRDWIFNIGVFFFVSAFETSHGPIWYSFVYYYNPYASWVYISEILPSSWMGYGTASFWILTTLVGYTSPYLFGSLGRWTYFLYFIFMVLVNFL